jgi:hypothetical protein
VGATFDFSRHWSEPAVEIVAVSSALVIYGDKRREFTIRTVGGTYDNPSLFHQYPEALRLF